MGQAAVDLPDPLDQATLGAAPSADDLLSQMASEEIDRLLAEAEGGVAAAAPGSPEPSIEQPAETPASGMPADGRTAAAELDKADPDTARQIDALFDELSAAPQAGTSQPQATADQQAQPEVEQQDSTATQQVVAAPMAAPMAQPQQVSAAAPAAVDPADQTGATERQVLMAETAAEDAAAAAVAPDAGLSTEDEQGPPWYLRLLETINAPFASCSDELRAAIGKIAIVTLVNAVAVLVYLLFFRSR